jgi:uncharacterized protein (DUF849 family)
MKKTFITCAVTGNLTKPGQTPYLPITPRQIVDESLSAYEEGAAIAHIHVRNPKNGAPSMDVELYAEVVEALREEAPELIINLTTGPGGRFIPSEDDPKVYAPGTTLLPPSARVLHILKLRPDICSLDLNTMNSGKDVVINTPRSVRIMAEQIRSAGVTPELEIFDSGDLHLALDLIEEGVLDTASLFTFVLGVKYGFAARPETLLYARDILPKETSWSAFGIGRSEFPIVAQSWLLGGNVRVGMEDNIYLSKGVLATSNAELVRKARRLLEDLGADIADSREVRKQLCLAPTNHSFAGV